MLKLFCSEKCDWEKLEKNINLWIAANDNFQITKIQTCNVVTGDGEGRIEFVRDSDVR